jgi:hypothetical protein
MLINLSNHPSAKWAEEQTTAAYEQFGSVVDLPFPAVDPMSDTSEIARLAEEYAALCRRMFADYYLPESQAAENDAVHLMGELNLCYALVNLLKLHSIKCVASTTQRNVLEEKDGKKTLIFKFVQFREYK